jgi:uncharacterized protein
MKSSAFDKLLEPKVVYVHTAKGTIKTYLADGFFSRMRGLLWRKPLAPKEAILLTPCHSVHTFGMSYPIDIVFLSPDYQVVRLVSNCMPRRMVFCKNAKHTLELAAGQATQLGIKIGAQLAVRIWL